MIQQWLTDCLKYDFSFPDSTKVEEVYTILHTHIPREFHHGAVSIEFGFEWGVDSVESAGLPASRKEEWSACTVLGNGWEISSVDDERAVVGWTSSKSMSLT